MPAICCIYWYLRAISYHFDCCMRFDVVLALLVSTKYTIEYARVKAILINNFISKESIKI